MDAAGRRRAIARALEDARRPVAASVLGERFGVSRQIVVGDVALLRAAGLEITATPRGYVLGAGAQAGEQRTVAVSHGIAAFVACVIVAVVAVVADEPIVYRFPHVAALAEKYLLE